MIAVYGLQDRQMLLLAAFKQLSQTGLVPKGAEAGHKDGWGIIVYDRNNPLYLNRTPNDPMNGSSYDLAVEEIRRVRPQIILGHLRKASCGRNSIMVVTRSRTRSHSYILNGVSHITERFGLPDWIELELK